MTNRRFVVRVAPALPGLLLLGWLFGAALGVADGGSAVIVPLELSQKAASEGAVHVIVKLRVPFTPEGLLRSHAAVGIQQHGIRTAQGSVLSALGRHGHAVRHRYDTIPFVALKVGPGALQALAGLPSVIARVEEDTLSAPLLAEGVPLVEGPHAWASGSDGTGQVIAILDTGVDSAHPFLAGKVVEEACFARGQDGGFTVGGDCPNGQETQVGTGSGAPCTYATSGCRHGTHVAGIAAGSLATLSGVAPGAGVMAVQVFSRFTGSPCAGAGEDPCLLSFTSDQMAALERVYNLRNTRTFAAVNMSLGGGQSTSPCDADPRKPIIDNLRAAGIATVIASGNDGFTNALSAPACISTAISVGSTGDGSHGAAIDQVSSFSNSAAFLSLLAPGAVINSSVTGGGFANFMGTSMAAPHVAGAWAILKQKAPNAPVSTLLNALQATGLAVMDSGNGISKSRIRISKALESLGLPPAATTNPATGTTPSTTILNGIVNPNSLATTAYFQWGSTPSYGHTTPPQAIGGGTTNVSVVANVSGLVSNATYHYRVVASNSAGTTVGVDRTFTSGSASPAMTFDDVPLGHLFFGWVESLVGAGITGGCVATPPRYCPESGVTRGQMAVFLLKGIAYPGSATLPTPTGVVFVDVPRGHPFAAWIEASSAAAITAGCGASPPRYCPDHGVTRGQMAVLLLRAKHGASYVPPAPTQQTFSDVGLDHPFAAWIYQLAAEGVTDGCATDRYCPDHPVTRGQMAVFLVRAFALPR
jgi:subtilisin